MLEKDKIKVEEKRINYTFPPWSYRLRAALFVLSGGVGMFGITKMPVINQSTKIAESVELVKNLPPDQLAALQGIQIIHLEKSLDSFKVDIKELLKEDRAMVLSKFEKIDLKIDDHTKLISRLEALTPRAKN